MTERAESSSDRAGDATATRNIAEAAASLNFTDHPQSVRDHVRRAVVDALGNALLAWDTPLGQSYRSSISRGVGDCYVIGGETAPPVDAAFANAGLINALDWDDTVEAAGHPGASVISTALALGTVEEATIEEVLNAIVIGYEASIRVARALQPSLERFAQVHGSGTRHAIGAASVAASLCARDRSNAMERIGFGAQLAPVAHAGKFGWNEERLTWLKDNVARAATAGVRAGTLDSRMTGPRQVLDGDRGFWRMAGSDRCDWDVLTASIDNGYLLPELAFKPYPCCRWLHATVEAAYEAADQVDDVASVHVDTTDRVATNFLIEPTNQVNAEFSLPFVVRQATAGRDPVAWYDEAGPSPTPDVEVTATATDAHTSRFAEHNVASATVTVTDDAGTQAEVTVTDPLGSKTRPLSPEASREKLRLGLDQNHDDAGQQLDVVESLLQTDESILTLHDALPQPNT